MPATSAGNMNLTRMKAAKPRPISDANPRQRATAITTAAKIRANAISGTRRSKSENWYWAGWPSAGGTRTSLTTCPTLTPDE